MNYIKQLQADLAESHDREVANAQRIAQLRMYLESSKFAQDRSVNVGDVLDHLAGVEFNATPIEIYGPVCERCHLHTYDGTDRHDRCE